MYEDYFSERLTALRMQKNVSAREMSLAIGQNESYINRIENRKTYPSMQAFFYICEYLELTPKEFFDDEIIYPFRTKELAKQLGRLSTAQLDAISELVKAFT
ncbi:MAG: helix-turn-helix domain-containing protein [Clostridiales bacterium]|nr:helix-turn-helix domain-containing protein [Clostridiales bacterium]